MKGLGVVLILGGAVLAYSAPSVAGDACASFAAKDGADRFDIAPPTGFVEVCSQDATLCRALTQGYPPTSPTVGYFVTPDEWAKFKKTSLLGFTNYLIAQVAETTDPTQLSQLKEFIRSKQGDIPDHTSLPEVIKVKGEANLGVVGETDDSIVFGKVAKIRTTLAPDKDINLVALNAAVVFGPRVLSLYSFREYRRPADVDAAKKLMNTWLQCLRGSKEKGGLFAQPGAAQAMRDIQRSHIDANTPDAADFEVLLRRDLTAYFGKARKKSVAIEYEPLRNGPTQSGVAYPKFYVWVTIAGGKTPTDRGAATVAAIEKKRFEVVEFVSEEAARSDPKALYTIFPAPVCDKINARVAR
jgi:hypothetical protein